MISCLMVSRPGRLDALQSAAEDFCRQTYPSRELVVVIDDADYACQVDEVLRDKDDAIYLVTVSSRLPLGALRNVALDSCHGEYACQWDDDDRYSPERLAVQINLLLSTGACGCFLHQQLHLFRDTGELFWTDWRFCDGRDVPGALSRIIPGSVLCLRDAARYPEEGDLARRGEDSVFASQLLRSGAIGIEAPPGTYLRTFHGRNTWDRRHHRAIAVHRSMQKQLIQAHRGFLEDAITYFGIPSPVKVMAGDTVVFRA
jgi:glycosyltransferase involved in cell wall biosynthesis